VHHPGAAVRFDAKTDRHHHLVCVQCHKIQDFESADLDHLPLPRGKLHGFAVSDYSVQLMGVCSDCRQRRK
jgi:Fe2+ or Zn2+ uptake regulation protein